MSEKIDYSKGVYDARQLGTGRMLILGVQHMFAMFGATVLVPLLTGLSVSTTLLCAGLGTLLFHLITKKKVPAFLGSSFAYLGGFSIVAPMLADADGNLTVVNTKMLPYACAAVAFSGLVYLVASLLISTFGIRRIMKFFPPVVTGPIIISIGLILAPSAIKNCQTNWLLAFVALGVVIICNIWGKGMVKILGLALANGFVALAGCVYCQQKGFFEVSTGTGTMVIGLASVIIGTKLLKRFHSVKATTAVIFGSIVYKACVSLAIALGMAASDLKLITAVLFLIILVASNRKERKVKAHA